MADFKKERKSRFGDRDSGRSSGRDSPRRSSFGDRESRGFGDKFPRRDKGRSVREGSFEKFTAVCDECGQSCELPFKPTNSKPVYCSECFRKRNNESPRFSESRSRGSSAPSPSADEIHIINMKLDKIMKALKIE